VVGGYGVAVEALLALAAATVVVVAAVGGGVCVWAGGRLAAATRVRHGSRQWPSSLGLLAVRNG
jgi:hypothetical protein